MVVEFPRVGIISDVTGRAVVLLKVSSLVQLFKQIMMESY